MSLTSLTFNDMFKNISNAFIGTISEMYNEENGVEENDKTIHILMKENRYMYLALFVLLLLIIGNLFFSEG